MRPSASSIRRWRNSPRAAPGSEAALIYFAGHGMQDEGRNYVMPVDAELQDPINLRHEMVGVDDIRDALEVSPGVKIMILNSCRDHPPAAHLVQAISGSSRDAPVLHGLGPAEPTQGIMIVYATQAGQVAIDGVGRNSPFAKALLEELAVPGLEVASLFREVEHKVISSTGGRQSPELSISGAPEFYLTPPPADQQAWRQIHDGRDGAALNGAFASLAVDQIDVLAGAPSKAASSKPRALTRGVFPVDATPTPSPTAKAASAAPEPPPKPAPPAVRARPAPAIVKPTLREPPAPSHKPVRKAVAPASPSTPAPAEEKEEGSSDGCPPHYFAHVFPNAAGYRCMPYP